MKLLSSILSILAVAILVNIGGCTMTHEAMRSSIVMKLEKEAHICIGAKDGIRVGDMLTVYRTKETPIRNQPIVPDRSGRFQPKVKFDMVKVGKARVIALLGEHYASVEPIDIVFEASDIIEAIDRR